MEYQSLVKLLQEISVLFIKTIIRSACFSLVPTPPPPNIEKEKILGQKQGEIVLGFRYEKCFTIYIFTKMI